MVNIHFANIAVLISLSNHSKIFSDPKKHIKKMFFHYNRILRKYLLRVAPVIAFSLSIAWCQTRLLVCVPGKQNTQLLQIGFDTLIGPKKAVVVGRIKDLDALLQANPDAAIISNRVFFNYAPGYSIALVGKKKTEESEKYFIVAASKEISTRPVSERKVGIVDFLIKDQLFQFIQDQFNHPITLLKRVNKEDDLLTMLGMEAVDEIIVSASQYDDILSNTKLPLTVVASSRHLIGFTVCAVKEGKGNPDLIRKLQKAPVPLLRELGIDSWEKP